MGVPIQVWRARIGGFSPNKKASRSAKFRATGSHGRTMFRGGPPVTICLLCACAILLLVSGIEPNPGPDTPRAAVPTPCDEPLVTPHRRATTKSSSDNAAAAHTVNCTQCNRSSPDQPTITCSICSESIHLGCLKAGKYLECQGWRKQEPPQYIGQLFNSPYFKFICHSCVSKPSPILQDDITVTMRSIEHKLGILTSTMAASVPDKETQQTTKSTLIHTIPSSTGEIAKALWTHIERKQHEHSDADDDKRSVVVTGAHYNDTLPRIDRNRNHTTFARQLISELEIGYIIHDDARNIDRVDWKRRVDYSDATYATWKAAVAGRRAANGAARNSPETQAKQTR